MRVRDWDWDDLSRIILATSFLVGSGMILALGVGYLVIYFLFAAYF